MIRRLFLFALSAVLGLAGPASAQDNTTDYAVVRPGTPFSFPADHGAHAGLRGRSRMHLGRLLLSECNNDLEVGNTTCGFALNLAAASCPLPFFLVLLKCERRSG